MSLWSVRGAPTPCLMTLLGRRRPEGGAGKVCCAGAEGTDLLRRGEQRQVMVNGETNDSMLPGMLNKARDTARAIQQ